MKHILKNELRILILAALLFLPFLGSVHLFDWDEINFAESAREMLLSGDYFTVQINYEPFWEKPPMFFWMQALSMKIFGINEFAARFPNALCGIVTLVAFFRIGRKIVDVQFARIWVMIYLGTFLPFLYFKSGIIDPWFNLFIFLAIYRVYLLATNDSARDNRMNALLAGLFLGFAVITKGPVAIVICVLFFLVILSINKFRSPIKWKFLLVIFGVVLLVSFSWFGMETIRNGPHFIVEFVQYQIRLLTTSEAGHGQPFFYHWPVLLFGCFPTSIFMIQAMAKRSNELEVNQVLFRKWMIVLFWVVLLLFSIVTTKIVHYSSLCYFPLTFLATLGVYEFIRNRDAKLLYVVQGLFAVIGVLLATLFMFFPVLFGIKESVSEKLNDEFVQGNLEADVNWAFTDSLGGLIFLGGVVCFWLIRNRELKSQLLFSSITICAFMSTMLIAPKVEAISQRANIEFFKQRQNEDCYVETINYKSYAHYFYAGDPENPLDGLRQKSADDNWLLYGEIDKTAYFSVKISDVAMLDSVPGIQKLYQKNGFAFYKREP